MYCPGELLQLVQLSRIFPDSKTFVDKPTKYSLNETYEAFSKNWGVVVKFSICADTSSSPSPWK
jgi:hypothetical protein